MFDSFKIIFIINFFYKLKLFKIIKIYNIFYSKFLILIVINLLFNQKKNFKLLSSKIKRNKLLKIY